MQTLYLATHFNPIYWDTACLIVNSGSLNEEDEESTDYGKIAKALGAIMSANIRVSLADINHSDFGFKPDIENNQILFGLKGMLNVGKDVVNEIIEKRPYVSIKDFYNKTHLKKQSMISLIKGGAFDQLESNRKFSMAWYIWEVCDKKKRITLQNMNGLIQKDLIPHSKELDFTVRVYEFNRYLKAICKRNNDIINYYLDERAVNFLTEIGQDDLIDMKKAELIINIKSWDKAYQKYMDVLRAWMQENQKEILNNLNQAIFLEEWQKYAGENNLSAWEMEALCFYFHEHELKYVNKIKYGISDFNGLAEEPQIDRSFKKGNRIINLFKIYKICGTCIAKNSQKATVTLLTTTGVVEVKFRKEYFAMFDKQISAKRPDGTKKIVEKSWFNRGNKIIVQGIRSNDTFIAKKYASQGGHTLYKIDEILPNGDLILRNERALGDE